MEKKKFTARKAILRIKLTSFHHKLLDKCVKDMMKYFQNSSIPIKVRSHCLPVKRTLICIPASNFIYGKSSKEHYKIEQKNRVLMLQFLMNDAAMAAVQDLLNDIFIPEGAAAKIRIINKDVNLSKPLAKPLAKSPREDVLG